MRYPFWKWTKWVSWLSVGLSGCLHGQDWRAAISQPRVRQVADRREMTPQPKVIGPRRTTKPNFVPPNNNKATPLAPKAMPRVSSPHVRPSTSNLPPVAHATPPAIAARPPAFTASGKVSAAQYQNEPIRPPTTHDEAQPRGAKVIPVEFVPPPAPPAAPPTLPLPVPMPASCLTATPSAPNVFAEFERLIPRRTSDITRVPDGSAAPEKFDEIVVVPQQEPTPPAALPVIIPARTFMTTNPPVVPQSLPPISPPESLEMTDISANTTESPSADQEPLARPRDVAVLVEQVFEDLRQRRLDEARQRTQWLKQLVAKRLPVPRDITAEEPDSGRGEPQRLRVDPGAAPVDPQTNTGQAPQNSKLAE